jgi:large subunit ribosomal protein L23
MNWQILKKPKITEKSMAQVAHSRYTFEVSKDASKEDIKREVEKQFSVKVLNVRTINYKPKAKRAGKTRRITYGAAFKKAIVLLPTDQKIDLFETATEKKESKKKKKKEEVKK